MEGVPIIERNGARGHLAPDNVNQREERKKGAWYRIGSLISEQRAVRVEEREEEIRRENTGEADRKRSEHAPAEVCSSYIWLQRVLTLFCHSLTLLVSPSIFHHKISQQNPTISLHSSNPSP